MLGLNGQGRHIDDLTKKVRSKNVINERLENVQEKANDTICLITDLQWKQKKMEHEISWLRDYVIRLEFCENVHKDQIVDLKSKSTENNVIITCLQDSQDKKEPENLAEIIKKILIIEMEMTQETTDNLKIPNIFPMSGLIETRNT